jgi:hypothetical protein
LRQQAQKKGLVIFNKAVAWCLDVLLVVVILYRTAWDLVFASGSFFSPKLSLPHTPSHLRATYPYMLG